MFAFSLERFVRERERERKVKKKNLIEAPTSEARNEEKGDGGERLFVCEVFLIGC